MIFLLVGVGLVGLTVGLWLAWALRRSGLPMMMLVAAGVPALAVLGYAQLGRVSLPDLPLAQRTEPAVQELRDLNEFRRMTGSLAERLQHEPDNIEAWTMLTRAYRTLGEWSFAIEAWARALALKGTAATAQDWSDLALLHVQAAEGQVTPAGAAASRKALEIDPQQADAQHFLAMQRAQQGDLKGAIVRWEALLANAPPDAGWRPAVERYLTQAKVRLSQPQRGPSAGDMAAASRMSEDDRAAMIQSMVEGLAARLEETPDDPAGWLRLARAYGVLGRKDEAAEALGNAERTAKNRLASEAGDRAAMPALLDTAAQLRKQLSL